MRLIGNIVMNVCLQRRNPIPFDVEIVPQKAHNFSNRSSRKSPAVLPPGKKSFITSLDPNPPQTIHLFAAEEPLRHYATALPTELGCGVRGAANGAEALAMAERSPAGIDVLITDVFMPELAGPELAITLRTSRPDLGIIFVSGDTSADCSVVQGAAVLQKPFTMKMLSSKLREVLPV